MFSLAATGHGATRPLNDIAKFVQGERFDFANCQHRSVLEINIPLMHRDELIAYKIRLHPPVDREDVEAMDDSC